MDHLVRILNRMISSDYTAYSFESSFVNALSIFFSPYNIFSAQLVKWADMMPYVGVSLSHIFCLVSHWSGLTSPGLSLVDLTAF